jgi:hypothetical protein
MARKFIALRDTDFNQLTKFKTAYENTNGGNPTDWGAFLLLILGIAASAAIVNEWMKNQNNSGEERR